MSQSKTTTPLSIIQMALARAKQFDAWPESEANSETLLAIGDAIGGVSTAGFVGDLERKLKNAVADLWSENRHVIGCGRYDTDPYYVPAWLEKAVETAEDDAACEWLEAVEPWTSFVSVLDTAAAA